MTDVLSRFLRGFAWDVAVSTVGGVLVWAALVAWAGWSEWSALLTGAAVVFAIRAVIDIWPRAVPPELAADVTRLEADGWCPLRHHPWLCMEKRPHAHLARPGSKPVTITHPGRRPIP